MDIFFLPFAAAALAEWGDKTQILAMLLAMRFSKPLPILLGIITAATINMSLAAFGGSLLQTMITPEAARLFLAVGFLLAAVAAYIPISDPYSGENWKLGAWATSAASFLAIEFGDKTQFLAIGFGATYGSWPVVAMASVLGVTLSCAPAVLMGAAFRENLPILTIRRTAGVIFFLTSSIIAINALSLI